MAFIHQNSCNAGNCKKEIKKKSLLIHVSFIHHPNIPYFQFCRRKKKWNIWKVVCNVHTQAFTSAVTFPDISVFLPSCLHGDFPSYFSSCSCLPAFPQPSFLTRLHSSSLSVFLLLLVCSRIPCSSRSWLLCLNSILLKPENVFPVQCLVIVQILDNCFIKATNNCIIYNIDNCIFKKHK